MMVRGISECSIYDSLAAKLIAHGRDRDEAIARIQRALEEFIIEGIKTTIPFHQLVYNSSINLFTPTAVQPLNFTVARLPRNCKSRLAF